MRVSISASLRPTGDPRVWMYWRTWTVAALLEPRLTFQNWTFWRIVLYKLSHTQLFYQLSNIYQDMHVPLSRPKLLLIMIIMIILWLFLYHDYELIFNLPWPIYACIKEVHIGNSSIVLLYAAMPFKWMYLHYV
jgi:hypothetical protein